MKCVLIRSYSGPYFPAFGLNTERYSVALRIQSECGKIRTRITPNMDTFDAVCCFINCRYSWRIDLLQTLSKTNCLSLNELLLFFLNPFFIFYLTFLLMYVFFAFQNIEFWSVIQNTQQLRKLLTHFKAFFYIWQGLTWNRDFLFHGILIQKHFRGKTFLKIQKYLTVTNSFKKYNLPRIL